MSFIQEIKEHSSQIWESGYQHPFVQEIGQGTLDRDKFKFYLTQDYLYLLEYAKVFAVAAAKADNETTLTQLTKIQYDILTQEMAVHREYLSQFGVTSEEILQTKPALFNSTYTSAMLSVAHTGDLAEILAAVLPCSWTYYDYAYRLKQHYASHLNHNIYGSWIKAYSTTYYQQSLEWYFETLDKLAERKNTAKKNKLVDIFISSLECEYLFWEMCYHQSMSLLP